MNRKRTLLILCIVVLAVGAVAFKASGKRTQATAYTPQAQLLPETVAYRFFFQDVAALKRKADEIEQQGKSSSLRSLIKRDANLSDEHAAALEGISFDCERDVKAKDVQAKIIIDAFRARFPGGKVPHGERLPPPPPELDALQQERDGIILHARDRLHAAMGEQDFQRFDTFVKNRIASETKIKSANP